MVIREDYAVQGNLVRAKAVNLQVPIPHSRVTEDYCVIYRQISLIKAELPPLEVDHRRMVAFVDRG